MVPGMVWTLESGKAVLSLLIFTNVMDWLIKQAVASTEWSGIQESPADARVAHDSSACIPPSWIFEISKLHH